MVGAVVLARRPPAAVVDADGDEADADRRRRVDDEASTTGRRPGRGGTDGRRGRGRERADGAGDEHAAGDRTGTREVDA